MNWKIVSIFVFGAFFIFFFFKVKFGGKDSSNTDFVAGLVIVYILALICTAIVFAIGNLLEWWD